MKYAGSKKNGGADAPDRSRLRRGLTVALAYIGDRLGIFRVMANGTPMTSQQLAERTRLNERYLREWATTMAASGYLDYTPLMALFD